MDRRSVLRMLAASTVVPCLEGLSAAQLLALGQEVHQKSRSSSALLILDGHADRTITLAAECILPAGDTPGATAAGVNRFIDRMLAGWYSAEERARFLSGLRELDAVSLELHGKVFADCPAEQQTGC